jgi:hypothetical protein
MTANQRRPGFRLPWSSEGAADQGSSNAAEGQPEDQSTSGAEPSDAERPTADAATPEHAPTAADASASTDEATQPETTSSETHEAATVPTADVTTPANARAAARSTDPSEPSSEATAPPTAFMGDLVAAMRRVADDARQSTLADLRARVDAGIRETEEEAERRRSELRTQAETDIAAVGEWAKAEAERIKADAEQRVAARRAQLERQLAAEASHVDSRADALRSRVTAYERELEAYHAQLAAINDPAAFAAAATRMPPPPALDGSSAPTATDPDPSSAASADSSHAPGTNGSAPSAPVEDEEGTEVPATGLAKLAATAPAEEPEAYAEPIATEIVVKGLGSFGSITGFRQQLANVEGIDAVGLSLGTSGEFVFRATHRPSLDMAAAISQLEGDAVEIEPRAEGGIRVTLGRPR